MGTKLHLILLLLCISIPEFVNAACTRNCDKNGYTYSMSNRTERAFKKTMRNTFNGAWKDKDNNAHVVTSIKDGKEQSVMKPSMMEIIEGLYTGGYITESQVDQWVTDYNNLNNSDKKPDSDNWTNKGKWWRLYWKHGFKDRIKDLSKKDIQCIKTGADNNGKRARATVGQCCQEDERLHGIDPRTILAEIKKNKLRYALPWIGFDKEKHLTAQEIKITKGANSGKQCFEQGQKCKINNECCSKQCMKEDISNADQEGTCAPILACYPLLPRYSECHPASNPYCVNETRIWRKGFKPAKNQYLPIQTPVSCMRVNHESTGINECKMSGNECSADSECCSDQCGVNGKCEEKYMCNACIPNGQKLGDVRPDFRGKYVDMNTKEGTNDPKKIFCCAGLWADPDDEDMVCQPAFPPLVLPDLVNPSGSVDKKEEKDPIKKTLINIVASVVNIIFPSAHAADGCNYYTAEQQAEISQKINDCIKQYPNDQEERESCMDGINSYKQAAREENYKSNKEDVDAEHKKCADEFGSNPDKYKECIENANASANTKCQQMSLEQYVNSYNIPQIRTKTYSDPATCRFNSFNDNWKDASNYERNAEIVIRGFEYLFSGQGAQDFWVQDGQGMNIYERSKRVADEIRRKRVELITKMRQMDIRLMCKCVKAKAGQGVPADVMAIFNVVPECEQDKAALAAITMAENGGDNGGSGLSQERSALGATGLTQSEYLATYALERMQIQMDRFGYYAELEEELAELSEYIQTVDWYEAEEGSELLYEFKVKWMATWFMIVLIILGVAAIVAVAVLTGGLGLGGTLAYLGSSVGGFLGIGAFTFPLALSLGIGTLALSTMLISAGVSALNKPNIKPKLTDVAVTPDHNKVWDAEKNEWKWDEGKCWNWLCTHRYFKIKRFYTYPKFDNAKYGASGKNRCVIKAGANLCMRNVYMTMFNGEMRYLIDVKKPLFVAAESYQEDTNFIQTYNGAYQYLIQHLKSTYPGGTTKRKFLKRDIMSEPATQKAMMPLQGTYYPAPFDENKTLAVLQAIVKFAECKEITGPNATEDCKVNMEGTEIEEGAMGFGYFFENQQDVKDFAMYVYQHHFHWPSLSSSQDIGYPLLAQNAYYQAMLHNLRIIGSSAAQRGLGYGDTYDQYAADWDKRASDYDCSATDSKGNAVETNQAVCAVIASGLKSSNVRYKKKFRTMFKKINFKTGNVATNIAGANTGMNVGTGSDNFSDAESNLLNLGNQHAIRTKESVKKAASFNKAVGNTARGKLINNAAGKWKSAFGSPMDKMKMTRGGEDFGGKGVRIGGKSTTINNVTNNAGSGYSYKAPKFKKYKNSFKANRNFKSSSGGYGGSSRSNYTHKTGSGTGSDSTDHSHLLDSAEKNQSMFKRDDADSIFTIISKTYFRNLSLILKRNGDGIEKEDKGMYTPKMKKLKGDKKEELKQLLEK